MRLNILKPARGSKTARKRAGRGYGSGLGRSAGRGDKGQKARAGGKNIIGFEGGQMPLHRRIPKIGFRSRLSRITEEVRLNELAKTGTDVVDLAALKSAHVVSVHAKRAKIIASGKVTKKVTIKGWGLSVSKGAREAIEKAGGRVEE